MSTVRAIFNEVAAYSVGFHGAMAGVKIAVGATETLAAAAGLTMGAVPLVGGLVVLGAGAYVGAKIGYRGAKSLIDDFETKLFGDGKPKVERDDIRRPVRYRPTQRIP